MAMRPGREGRPWRRLKAQVYAEETQCWLCRQRVDQLLPQTHRLCRTVDHIMEIWQGGNPLDRGNCHLAHRACNSAKSLRLRAGHGLGTPDYYVAIARAHQPRRRALSVDVNTL